MPRFDYAVFDEGDAYITNAMLTEEEAERMVRDGYHLTLVRDTVWENLPRFRGRRSVAATRPFRRRWPGR